MMLPWVGDTIVSLKYISYQWFLLNLHSVYDVSLHLFKNAVNKKKRF